MNQTLTLTPKLQIAQPSPAPVPRLSLTRVLWYKFLRWIEKSSASVLLKAAMRLMLLATVLACTIAPNFVLGYLTASLRWNSYRLPLCILAVALTLNAKRLYLLLRRQAVSSRGANQYTYHGLPVAEVADFLHARHRIVFAAMRNL